MADQVGAAERQEADERRQNCTYVSLWILGSSSLLLAAALFGPFYTADAKVVRWAHGPWIREVCAVRASGVAYRGTCEIVDTVEYEWYHDCNDTRIPRTEEQSLNGENSNVSGVCEARGNNAYHGAGQSDDRSWGTQHRRLRSRSWHHYEALTCYDAYLTWASVQIVSSVESPVPLHAPRGVLCGYSYGAASVSIIDDWIRAETFEHSLKMSLRTNRTIPCWRFGKDQCVVALRHPKEMRAQEAKEVAQVQVVGAACGLLSLCGLCFCIVHYRFFLAKEVAALVSQAQRFLIIKQCDYEPVPTDDSVIDTRAKRIVDAAVANPDEDDVPESNQASLRVVAPGKRNLAVDLLKG